MRRFLLDYYQGAIPSTEQLERLCQPYLEPGERPDGVFCGRRDFGATRWIVVTVTDRALLVVETPPVTRTWEPLQAQTAYRLPRATRIGPRYGLGWYLVGGRRMFTASRKYQRFIAEADAAMGFPPPA